MQVSKIGPLGDLSNEKIFTEFAADFASLMPGLERAFVGRKIQDEEAISSLAARCGDLIVFSSMSWSGSERR